MKLNDNAIAAMDTLSGADAAYCAKLSQRFEAMGISSKAASGAICTLVEKDAVPGQTGTNPTRFPFSFFKKQKVEAMPELEFALAE